MSKNKIVLDVMLFALGLLPAAVALLLYHRLPERMATHFNTSNQADNYMSKPMAITVLALLGVAVPLLMKYGKRLDPNRAAYTAFESTYTLARIAITVLISGVGLFLVAYNLGHQGNVRWFTSIILGGVMVILGNALGRVRPNYTFGIRMPWTLADEKVWRRTHRMAAPIWVVCGLIMMLSVAFPANVGIGLLITAVVIAMGWPSIYSYQIYKKEAGR